MVVFDKNTLLNVGLGKFGQFCHKIVLNPQKMGGSYARLQSISRTNWPNARKCPISRIFEKNVIASTLPKSALWMCHTKLANTKVHFCSRNRIIYLLEAPHLLPISRFRLNHPEFWNYWTNNFNKNKKNSFNFYKLLQNFIATDNLWS